MTDGYSFGDRVSPEDAAKYGANPADPALYRRPATSVDDYLTPTPQSVAALAPMMEAAGYEPAPPVDPDFDGMEAIDVAESCFGCGRPTKIRKHDRAWCDLCLAQKLDELADDELEKARKLRAQQLAEEEQRRHDQLVAEKLEYRRADHEARERHAGELATKQAAQRKLRITSGFDFLYGDLDDDTPIWGTDSATGWAEGESLMIFGPPNVGKSTLAHQLVLGRLGLIPEVLGMPVRDDGGRVLYVAADRPRQIRGAFRRLARPEWKDVLSERIVFHEGPLPVDITIDKDWLADLAQQREATTVVIDSVKDVCAGPSEDRPANGYNLARQECITRGIEWLELHHNRKANADNKKPTKLDDVYGSRWLTGGAGSVVGLWGEAGDRIVELIQVKTPSGLIYPTKVEINFSTGGMAVYTDGRPRTALEVVQRGPLDGLTADQVATALGKPTTGKGLEAVRVQLDRHATRGDIVKHQRNPITHRVLYAPLPEPLPFPDHSGGSWLDIDPTTNR